MRFAKLQKKLTGHYVYVCQSGIGFGHDGDEVIWLYPWRRSARQRAFLSISFEGTFATLRELDNLWEDYFAAGARDDPAHYEAPA